MSTSSIRAVLIGVQSKAMHDPLKNPSFRAPGLWERFRAGVFGAARPLDCVQVEVTSRCPGRCLYCPHTTMAEVWRSRHMDAAVFAALWPVLRAAGRVHLQGWGEPLLHPRFFDFAALARKAGCRVSTTSCGLHMDAACARRLVESELDVVAFSLAGTDAATNAVRAGVPFERVQEAIRVVNRVREAGRGARPEIHLAYLLLADRIEAARDLPRLMDEWNVPVAVVSTLDYIAAPGLERLAFAPTETAGIARAREVLEDAALRAWARGRRIRYALPAPRPAEGCRENIERTLYVDAEGSLSPCIYVNLPVNRDMPERRVLGNVLESDPLACWNGPRFAEFRAALAHGVPEQPCRACAKRFEREGTGPEG